MALHGAVSGPYSATWDSNDLGNTMEGFRIVQSVSKQTLIVDAYGDSVIDGVYRGGNVSVILTAVDWAKIETAGCLFPYGDGVPGIVGRMDVASALVKSLVLTATAGTPAATNPATWTAASTIISENHRNDHQYAAVVRQLPIEFRCYLYDNLSVPTWFVVT